MHSSSLSRGRVLQGGAVRTGRRLDAMQNQVDIKSLAGAVSRDFSSRQTLETRSKPLDAASKIPDEANGGLLIFIKARWRDRLALSRRAEVALVWVCAALASLLYAFKKGQDINWDQLNYHIYSIYSLFNNRVDLDIIPSQLQTWTNPFGALLPYFLIRNTSPVIASAILAATASLAVPLVYFLTRNILNRNGSLSHLSGAIISFGAAIGAFCAPTFLSELGTSFNDYLGNIFLLLALLVVVKRGFVSASYLLAGVFIGLALDIKLTNVFFIVGWVVATIAVEKKKFIIPLFYSGIGSFASYAAIGGAWNIYVYNLFKNPVFPLYNHIFKSDSYAHVAMLDARFKPQSFASALEYFPRWALGEHPTAEMFFRDTRFLVALVVLVLASPRVVEALFMPEEDRTRQVFEVKPSLFVLFFVIGSFVAWLALFGIERYAILLEQLAPLAILILLSLLCGSLRTFMLAATTTIIAILATTHAANWGRVPFGKNWYAVKMPEHLQRDDIMFVMLSKEPTSYIIPSFPKSDAFIRIESNMPLTPNEGLGQAALQRFRSHQGELRTLAPATYDLEQAKNSLGSFDLEAISDGCLDIETKAGNLRSCPLTRRAP